MLTVQAPRVIGGIREPFHRGVDDRPLIPSTPDALYAFGSLIRACESTLLECVQQNLISGTTHTCLGQELCQISVVRALSGPHDQVWSNHRNHGHFLTHTGDVVSLFAEVMGRENGACGGVGGSQHLHARGFYSSGVQGGLTAIAVGHAAQRRRRARDGVSAVFIGDGTLGEGLLYESMNLAAIWRVPVLFVVENNEIAQSTPTRPLIGGAIRARGDAFGLRTWALDDADGRFLDEVAAIVGEVRSASSPGLLVIDTRRLGPHSKGDDTRSEVELSVVRERDPLRKLAESLPEYQRREIDERISAFVSAAREVALNSARSRYHEPPSTIFRRRPTDLIPPVLPNTEHGTIRAGINATLRHLLSTDEDVVILGEDLADPYGGAFKVTAGLSKAFPGRVVSTPISEAAIVGAGIGMALDGGRAIVEIMFGDFLGLAVDQILNHAVKFAGMWPDAALRLVIRAASGAGRGYGPTHSQALEAMASAIPGLTVLSPTSRHSPDVVRRALLSWGYPTIVFEHKLLYGATHDRGPYELVEADARDPGAALFPTLVDADGDADVVIVTYGAMLSRVEDAAEQLRREELTVTIVAVQLLSPMPVHTLMTLLMSASHVMVVEESHPLNSFGAQLGAAMLEHGYRGRFRRLGTPPVPIGAARTLEQALIPDAALIVETAIQCLVSRTPCPSR